MKGIMTMKSVIKLLSLILALLILFTACGMPFSSETESMSRTETQTQSTADTEGSETEAESESEMSEYRLSISRTPEELESMLTITDEAYTEAESQLAAFEKIAIESTDLDAIDEVYLAFEKTYDYISTQVSIASIIYYIDMSNEANYERYNNLFDKYGDIYNAYVESCKNVYNNSAVRDELFADWTEKEIKQMLNYSPETQELQLKNDELTNELNNLNADQFDDRSAEIYAEIVTNNNRIAQLAGYDNYYDYASKEIYCRDYGREDLEKFCNTVIEEYVPYFESLESSFYTCLYGLGKVDYEAFIAYLYDPFDSLDTNYLTKYISSLPESMNNGMNHAFVNRNIVFSNEINSHPTAFQTYLDDLEAPFCLFGINGQSTSTIVHEFGHYYASLHAETSSYDLAEVQSQGNEMLLLAYMKSLMNPKVYGALRGYTMYANMNTIISCVIIDEFEREVYSLDSVVGFKSADFDAIMTKVCEKYGGVDWVWENVGDMNDYWRQVATNNPVYYISYAISLTSAMNLYASARSDMDAGCEAYRILVEEVTEEDTYLTMLKKAGLPSPFDTEATEQVISVVWGMRPATPKQ